mmetsp:Transcript_39449/g.91185  ORF Transcript_39449/g.91185 Transcript_39449/m.91185 type:complete len:208 (-) Transcript_39449:18-641(-)
MSESCNTASSRFWKPSMLSAISARFFGQVPKPSPSSDLNFFNLIKAMTSRNQPAKTPFSWAGPPAVLKPAMLKGVIGEASLNVKPVISSPIFVLESYLILRIVASRAHTAVQLRPGEASSHCRNQPQISDSSLSMFTSHLPPSACPANVPCTWSGPVMAFRCALAPTPAALLLSPPARIWKVEQSSVVQQRSEKVTRSLLASGMWTS